MLTSWLESLFDFQWRKDCKLFYTCPLGFLMDTGQFQVRFNRVERFLTLNETGKIIANKALRFFRQPVATTQKNLIAEVVDLRGERVNLDRKGGYERKADLAAAHDHLAEGWGDDLCESLN